MNPDYSLVGMVRVLIKWRKYLIAVPLVVTLLAGLISWFFMDDYFLSSATFYPVNLALSDRRMMFNTEQSVAVEFYGTKDDVNRLLTISQSRPVEQYLISKYHLATHYKIDTTARYWRTKVHKEFDKNYKAIKTEQNAIEISVYDTDPQLAATMVNDALALIDSMNKSTIATANKLQLDLFTKQITEEKRKVDAYADTLADLGEKYKISVKTGATGVEIVDGLDYKAVQAYKALIVRQRSYMTELNNSTNIMERIQATVNAQTNSLSVITPPTVSDRKEKPVRSLICAVTFLITLIVCSFGVFAIERAELLRGEL